MNSKSKSVATTTVGYMCLGLTGWMISMSNAAWFPNIYPDGTALLYPLAAILGVIGILAFFQNRTLDAIVFFGGAGLLGWTYRTWPATSMEPHSYMGWAMIVWAVFFCYVWLGSFKSGILRMLFLLGLWLTLLALAIGNWASLHVIIVVGGYIGLVTSILAVITSAREIIKHGFAADANAEVS